MSKENVLKKEEFQNFKLQNEFSMLLANVTIPAVIYEASGQNLSEAKQIMRGVFNNAETILVKTLDKSQLASVNTIKGNALEQAFLTLEMLEAEKQANIKAGPEKK